MIHAMAFRKETILRVSSTLEINREMAITRSRENGDERRMSDH